MDTPIYNDWSVISTIGAGTYGKVYLVERKTEFFAEQAALKVITFTEDDFYDVLGTDCTKEERDSLVQEYVQKMIDQTHAEARIGSQLSRECINIVKYRDFQVQRNQDGSKVEIIILMDLLKPLMAFWDSEIIREKAIIKLGIDICNALIQLEKHHVVHRDVKPSNLFVDEFGNYILGDFGGAILIDDERDDYGISRMGTLNYIAPEVYSNGTYTHSVDIYGLGLVLFRFLNNGFLPFTDKRKTFTFLSNREAMERRLSGEIPTLQIENKELSSCVIKAIHPDVEKRYCSAAEFKRDLEFAYKKSFDVQYTQRGTKQSLPSVEASLTAKVLYQAERSLSLTLSPHNVQINLLAQDSLNQFIQLSDADLAHIAETSVIILSNRAYCGNPHAQLQLDRINRITKTNIPVPIEDYRKMILKACVSLVENASYSKSTQENAINDYIRDILAAQDNIVQDQTRQGRSSSGKSAGEVDIKITFGDYEPALIEALKAASLDGNSMEDHIKRLMVSYDPIGVYCHFLLVYYCGHSFSVYTDRLNSWLKTCNINQITFNDINSQRLFTNIAEIRVKCTREGHQEELVIIIMNINK